MDVSIIIVNYNGGPVLRRCLEGLSSAGLRVSHEIIVVDNASTDGSADGVERSRRGVTVIRHGVNGGFGSGCNLGARHASGRTLLFLNPDALAEDDFLSPMLQYLDSHPDVGVMGPRHLYEDRTFQLTAGVLPNLAVEAMDKTLYFCHRRRLWPVQPWLERRFSEVRDVQWVAGACLLIRRSLFESVGGFDQSFFLYFEEKDLCRRALDAGMRVVFFPPAHVTHLLGRSSQEVAPDHLRKAYRESQSYYYRKHHGPVQQFLLRCYHAVSS